MIKKFILFLFCSALFASSSNQLAFEICQKQSETNFFFSPYSISSCFTLAYLGSEGITKDELEKKLHLDEKIKNVDIEMANILWLISNDQLTPYYESIIQNYKIDFLQGELPISKINKLVEDKTHGKISKLLSVNEVPPTSSLVLINAIYFKSLWQFPFLPEKTIKRPFYSNGTTFNVDTLFQKMEIPYFENEEVQMVTIPFENKEKSFVVILPKNSSFKEVKETLSWEKVNEWLLNSEKSTVIVRMPKFKMTQKYDLKQFLDLPISTSYSAQFSQICVDRSFYISSMIHQSFIELDEKGVEAAAATAITMATTCSLKEPTREYMFIAEHPFLFLIMDNRSKEILFIGGYVQP